MATNAVKQKSWSLWGDLSTERTTVWDSLSKRAGMDTEKMTSQTPPKKNSETSKFRSRGGHRSQSNCLTAPYDSRFHTLDHSFEFVLDCPLYSNP